MNSEIQGENTMSPKTDQNDEISRINNVSGQIKAAINIEKKSTAPSVYHPKTVAVTDRNCILPLTFRVVECE